MKKLTFKFISLTIIFTHLFSICLRDLSFAAGLPNPQKPITKVTREDLIGYSKKNPAGASKQEVQGAGKPFLKSSGGQESFSPEKAIKNFYLDPFSGALSLSLPLFTSPGRKGVQSNLNLTYSSRNGNGPFGWGWRLDFGGYIERSNKKGSPKYDATDTLEYRKV